MTYNSDPINQPSQLAAVLVERSRKAQAVIENYSQEQVDQLIKAMVWAVAQPGVAEEIAALAVEETGLGDYAGKLGKMTVKCRAALAEIIDQKSVGVIESDSARRIVKIAKPMGVVCALTPVTHPEASPVVKAISAVKGRNSIIVAPHPRAKRTCHVIFERMRDALERQGAPADLLINVQEPSLEVTGDLMAECDVVLATGGAAMVKAAYSSGTPAFGVGAGNAVITVDSSANLDDCVQKIVASKTLDLATSCSADNSVIALQPIRDELLQKLQDAGGYLVKEGEYDQLRSIMWQGGHLNPDIIAQPATKIAELAGLAMPEGKTFIIVVETGFGPEYPFSGEKLSVVMAYYSVQSVEDAIKLTNDIQRFSGYGHSCGFYGQDGEIAELFCMQTKTSRVMINQAQASSNSGALWNGMPQTFSLGCGSWGGNITTDNITWRNLVNVTWVSRELAEPKLLPSDRDLFGSLLDD